MRRHSLWRFRRHSLACFETGVVCRPSVRGARGQQGAPKHQNRQVRDVVAAGAQAAIGLLDDDGRRRGHRGHVRAAAAALAHGGARAPSSPLCSLGRRRHRLHERWPRRSLLKAKGKPGYARQYHCCDRVGASGPSNRASRPASPALLRALQFEDRGKHRVIQTAIEQQMLSAVCIFRQSINPLLRIMSPWVSRVWSATHPILHQECAPVFRNQAAFVKHI